MIEYNISIFRPITIKHLNFYIDTKPTKQSETGKQCKPGTVTECAGDNCNLGPCNNKGCLSLTCTKKPCPPRGQRKTLHQLCFIDRNNCDKHLICTKQDDGCNNGVGRCVMYGELKCK